MRLAVRHLLRCAGHAWFFLLLVVLLLLHSLTVLASIDPASGDSSRLGEPALRGIGSLAGERRWRSLPGSRTAWDVVEVELPRLDEEPALWLGLVCIPRGPAMLRRGFWGLTEEVRTSAFIYIDPEGVAASDPWFGEPRLAPYRVVAEAYSRSDAPRELGAWMPVDQFARETGLVGMFVAADTRKLALGTRQNTIAATLLSLTLASLCIAAIRPDGWLRSGVSAIARWCFRRPNGLTPPDPP
jgi:hypothetical protein